MFAVRFYLVALLGLLFFRLFPSLSSGNLWQDPVGSGTRISGFMDFISWHSGSLALHIALQSMLKDLSFKQRSPLWISVRSKSKFLR
jgi:uncharacterized membrane protein